MSIPDSDKRSRSISRHPDDSSWSIRCNLDKWGWSFSWSADAWRQMLIFVLVMSCQKELIFHLKWGVLTREADLSLVILSNDFELSVVILTRDARHLWAEKPDSWQENTIFHSKSLQDKLICNLTCIFLRKDANLWAVILTRGTYSVAQKRNPDRRRWSFSC